MMRHKECKKCKYIRKIYANDGFSFLGCNYAPYRGKWITEIKACPKNNEMPLPKPPKEGEHGQAD